jgi:hypothetical protein
MRRLVLLSLTAALAAGGAAAAAPPPAGLLVPGESLGGLNLGVTAARATTAWGTSYGVCRSCERTTWYFNYRPFEPQGAGVELRRGRVTAIFTLWQPAGWRTREGLRLGDGEERVTALYGPLPRAECAGYAALTLRRPRALTVFYVLGDEVWGFGLLRPGASACRE